LIGWCNIHGNVDDEDAIYFGIIQTDPDCVPISTGICISKNIDGVTFAPEGRQDLAQLFYGFVGKFGNSPSMIDKGIDSHDTGASCCCYDRKPWSLGKLSGIENFSDVEEI